MQPIIRLVLFAVLTLFVFGCGRKLVPIKETFTRSDTTIIRERTVPVFVPGSNVAVDLDSLARAWGILGPTTDQNIFIGEEPSKETATRVYTVIDPKQQTKLTIYYDSIKKQMAGYCETLDKTYQTIIQEKERTIREQRETMVKEQKSFAEQLKQLIFYIVGGAGVLVIVLVIGGYFALKNIPRV